MWRRWGLIRQFKLNFVRLMRLRLKPEEIAKGLALGISIGMTPTLGFQMVIALFFAILLKENKIAAALGVWITNPVTAPFIYAAEYETGRILLHMPHVGLPHTLSYAALKHLGWEVIVPLGVGSLLYAVVCGALTYFVTLRLVPAFKGWRIPRWPKKRRN